MQDLIELYAQEAQAQTQLLNTSLLALERGDAPQRAAQLEACMRAAHSLKGAARVVGLDAGVKVAHEMEELLVAAQRGTVHLQAAHIDALLQGSDLLLQIGRPGTLPHELTARTQAWLLGLAAAQALVTKAPAEAASTPLKLEVSSDAAELAAPVSSDRMIKVSAGHLDRLLDLAGKCLVAFERGGQLAAELAQVKQQHVRQRRTLELLQAETRADSLAAPLVSEARHALAACQSDLLQHMERMDDFVANGRQRARLLYEAALGSRMRPLADVLDGRARLVRDLARSLGKQARLEVEGANTPADRDVLARLDAPLTHLLRNAVDHGLETPEQRLRLGKPAEGLLRLTARHHHAMLALELRDDGPGVDLPALRAKVVARQFATAQASEGMSEGELLAFLFLPGFSMREQVNELSGRGVGLDAVQHELRALHGNVRLTQQAGRGCTFHLEVPLTRSVVRSLVVEIAGETYALPLAQIERMLQVVPDEVVQLEGHQHVWWSGQHVVLISARQLLQCGDPQGSEAPGLCVVLLGSGEQRHGLVVDRFIGQRTLVLAPLDPRLGKIRDVAAAALLDDDTPVLILDVDDLCSSAARLLGSGQLARVRRDDEGGPKSGTSTQRVLVVDDSFTVRELQRKLLQAQGYEVTLAVDGMDGWTTLRAEPFDLLITDVDMPRMDGIALVTQLRRDPRLQTLPVLVVSYKDRPEDRQRGLDAGADHYLAKANFHEDDLLDAVQMLIGKPQP